MRLILSTALILSLFLCTCQAGAQSPEQRQPPPDRGRPFPPPEAGGLDDGPGGPGGGPPLHPLMRALDTDGDGQLSADEIDSAAAALKKLDEDGDGQLTMNELRPAFGRFPDRGGQRADRPQRPQRPDGSGNGRERNQRRRLRGEGRPPGPRRGDRPDGAPGSPPGPGQQPGPGAEPFDASAFAERILSFDKNDDGQITKEELPQRMQAMVDHGDTSGDGALDQDEIEALGKPR